MFRDKYKLDNQKIKPDKALIRYLSARMKDAASDPSERQSHPAEPKKKRGILHTAAAIAACLAIFISAGGLYVILDKRPQNPAVETGNKDTSGKAVKSPVKNAATYSELYALIKSMEEENNSEIFFEDYDNRVASSINENAQAGGSKQQTDNAKSTEDHSRTNTQVQGVDEADIVKTDGSYIYVLTGNQIKIVRVNGPDMKILSSISFPDNTDEGGYSRPSEFYITENRLIALNTTGGICADYGANRKLAGYEPYMFSEQSVTAVVYDITDRSDPQLLGELGQSGDYLSSRMVGQTLYLISNHSVHNIAEKDSPKTYVPMLYINGEGRVIEAGDITISADPQSRQYIVISAIDVNKPEKQLSSKSVFGCGTTIYAGTENLFIAGSSNERTETAFENPATSSAKPGQTTAITPETTGTNSGKAVLITDVTNLLRFSLNNGKIELAATGKVKGRPLNQFSMDEYDGVFRIVTTVNTGMETVYGSGKNTYVTYTRGETANSLYTLNQEMEVIGKIEDVARGERVYSVRFIGDIGYFVTFRQTDPLFAVDLKDPARPRILSALKIPGFSQYLHPWSDGLLFGLGHDADDTGRAGYLKLSMFDVSNPEDVTEKHKTILDGYYYSEASYNHRAIIVSPERGIIAFPSDNRYIIYTFTGNGFAEKAVFSIDDNAYNQRGLYIGNVFYVCTINGITAFSMEDYSRLNTLKF
jgi:inhibitor of cysteine peptidase